MKKIFIVLVCTFILFGCTKKEELKNTYDIELDSNPSTGYTWSYDVSEEGIVKFTKDEFVLPEESKNLSGAPGKQIYQITGESEGEVEITFTYSRKWEEDSLDASGFTYKFKVDKNLNVKLISKDNWVS